MTCSRSTSQGSPLQSKEDCAFSIVVIAQNEESNLDACLRPCVTYSDDVWLVDSFSTDNTVAIGERTGAHVIQHVFESWGAQRNYALSAIEFKHDYILFLDADEQIDARFSGELNAKIACGAVVAFNVNFDIIFLGRVLRHSHDNPPVLRVVKQGVAMWVSEGAREYCTVNGPVGKIEAKIRHEDRKGIFFWLMKHIRNAEREALLFIDKGQRVDVTELARTRHFERPFRVRLRRLYGKMPPILRPYVVFFYRYFVRLGFLDGYPGLVFCALQALWYNLIIDARVYEMKLGHDCYLPPYGGCREPRHAASSISYLTSGGRKEHAERLSRSAAQTRPNSAKSKG